MARGSAVKPVFQMFDKTEAAATLNVLYMHGSYNVAEAGQALPQKLRLPFIDVPRRATSLLVRYHA